MPKDKRCNACNACNSPLSPHRQKSFFKILDGQEKEVCKSCYNSYVSHIYQEPKINDLGHVEKKDQNIKSKIEPVKSSIKKVTKDLSALPDVKKVQPKKQPKLNEALTKKNLNYQSHKEEVNIGLLQDICAYPVEKLLFLDCETTSLDEPSIIELAIVDFNGNVIYSSRFATTYIINESAFKAHGINKNDLINCPSAETELQSILTILKNKRVVTYNTNFDFRALKFTFSTPSMNFFFSELEKNSICLMAAIKLKLKLYKPLSLTEACKQFDVEKLPAHNAINDAYMLQRLYTKFLELIVNNTGEWLPKFEDINFKHLIECKRNESIPYWSSTDSERQALYLKGTAGGSGKIAELSKELKYKLNKFGSFDFFLEGNCTIPIIKVITKSEAEASKEFEQEIKAYKDSFNQELLNAKIPKHGKLRLTFREYYYSNRYSNTLFLTKDKLYQRKYSDGDTLYLSPLTFTADFNYRDVVFMNEAKEDCGRLLNVTKAWTRVFGILMKGYRAEVKIINSDKNASKVDVYFIKLLP
ncbi:3'-5' exonuclease [Psychromonas sp. PT13]|uniref:3'-5' exonuclease n=1 Tax=Psychromonas sp. PT13 TaxID=3439547 RepID=UPI003EBE785C